MMDYDGMQHHHHHLQNRQEQQIVRIILLYQPRMHEVDTKLFLCVKIYMVNNTITQFADWLVRNRMQYFCVKLLLLWYAAGIARHISVFADKHVTLVSCSLIIVVIIFLRASKEFFCAFDN